MDVKLRPVIQLNVVANTIIILLYEWDFCMILLRLLWTMKSEELTKTKKSGHTHIQLNFPRKSAIRQNPSRNPHRIL
jgi:hypothetical protein